MKEQEKVSGNYINFLPSIYQKSLMSEEDPFFQGYLNIFEKIWGDLKDSSLQGFMFSISPGHFEKLNNGEISKELEKQFSFCAHPLSKNTMLEVLVPKRLWKIIDHDQQYFLRMEQEKISVYMEGKLGLTEILDVLVDLFHPRFSFLFSEFDTSFLPTLKKQTERKFTRYINSSLPFKKWLDEYLAWLANWMSLTLRKHWSVQKKRMVISKIIPLYRMRGTKKGLEQYLKIYIDGKSKIHITEPLKAFLVEETSIVEGDHAIEGSPYFFIVNLTLPRMLPDEMKKNIKTLEEIIEMEKPVYTVYKMNVVTPTIHIDPDVDSDEGIRLEINTIIGE